MTAPTYLTSCPRCGSQLAPVALGADTAPWLCSRCQLGFWASELAGDARTRYRPNHRDFGYFDADIRGAVHLEREAARQRRTSVRDDQLSLLPAATLEQVAKRADPAFAAAIAAHLAQPAD